MNQLVLGGNNIMIGPANYLRGMDYPPMKELCRYVGEVTRIRRELYDIRLARAMGGLARETVRRANAALRMSGSFAESPHAGWTVFADTRTGKRAIVLANLGGERWR